MVKNQPCKAEDVGLIPDLGTKISCVVEQLSPSTATKDPTRPSMRACVRVCVCSVVSDSLPPRDWSSPGSSVYGIFQARILELGCHFLLQEDLPDPGIESMSPVSFALAGGFYTTEPPGKPT